MFLFRKRDIPFSQERYSFFAREMFLLHKRRRAETEAFSLLYLFVLQLFPNMKHFFPDMAHHLKPSFLALHHHQQRRRRMKSMYWVYITEDGGAGITIGFSADMDKTFLELSIHGRSLFYLRSFSVPFDALAHKHLLEDLSLKTIRRFIRNHREETKRCCDRLLFNY